MALFDKNKPFIGGRIYDYIFEIWARLDNTPDNNGLNAAATIASNAQTSANNAQTSANNAQTSANNAQSKANSAVLAASGAQDTANIANSRLSGDLDYYEGTGVFTGSPNGLLISSLTTITSQGIDYNAGFFNFSYLGKYAIWVSQGGDCANTRTDWYQEVKIQLKEVIGNIFVPFTFKSIPPNGTWNMETTNSNMINVLGGNQWKVAVFMTAGGSTTNGNFKIKIKKII